MREESEDEYVAVVEIEKRTNLAGTNLDKQRDEIEIPKSDGRVVGASASLKEC